MFHFTLKVISLLSYLIKVTENLNRIRNNAKLYNCQIYVNFDEKNDKNKKQ